MFTDDLETYEKNPKPKKDQNLRSKRCTTGEDIINIWKLKPNTQKTQIHKNIYNIDIKHCNRLLKEILDSPWSHLKDGWLSRKRVSVKHNSVRAKAKVAGWNLETYDLQDIQVFFSFYLYTNL